MKAPSAPVSCKVISLHNREPLSISSCGKRGQQLPVPLKRALIPLTRRTLSLSFLTSKTGPHHQISFPVWTGTHSDYSTQVGTVGIFLSYAPKNNPLLGICRDAKGFSGAESSKWSLNRLAGWKVIWNPCPLEGAAEGVRMCKVDYKRGEMLWPPPDTGSAAR